MITPRMSNRRTLHGLIRCRLLTLLLAAALCGCQSNKQAAAKPPTIAGALQPLPEEDPGFVERMKSRLPWYQKRVGPEYNAQGIAELEEAKQLFQEGKYQEAEKIAKRVEKTYRDNPVEEEAIFLRAEAFFAMERYSHAQDHYANLMKRFPSTRHLDRSTRQLFTIAQRWLGSPEFVQASEIQPVNWQDPAATPQPKESRAWSAMPLVPNFTDKTRPLFDTEGRALEALRAIWLNDPTGRLADDALMLSASHHMRRGNYLEADRLLTLLREEYPRSPHLQTAFLVGSHVKLLSYQGPAYDGQRLHDAELLKESTLRLFPEFQDKERLQEELRRIEEARAEREWDRVRFWQRKNKPNAVAMYCRYIIETYPNTECAVRARQTLAELGPEYVSDRWLYEKITPKTPAASPAEPSETREPGRISVPPDEETRPIPPPLTEPAGRTRS